MIIKTGLRPHITSHMIPKFGEIAYELERTTFTEPMNNPEPIEVWIIFWIGPDGNKTGDFLLSRTRPEANGGSFSYVDASDLPERSKHQEDFYRNSKGAPDDALVKREELTPLTERVTISWWEVIVP